MKLKQQTDQLKQKWQALPPGDQRALGALILFLGALFLVYGLFFPAKNFFDRARTEAEQARALMVWMESQQPALQRLDLSASGNGAARGTLLQRVTSAADRHKVTIKRFEPEGEGRIRLWVDEVRYEDLQPWLNTLLQQRFSIIAINLDALPQPGMVSARLTLEG